MKHKGIPLGLKSSIESRLEDLDLLLNSCLPVSAMFGLKNLSSDLRAEVDTRKNISHEEYADYMKRLDKMILNSEKNCKCKKIKK